MIKNIVYRGNLQASFRPGAHSFVTIDIPLEKIYGKNRTKRRLGLKIFKEPVEPISDTIQGFKWKKQLLLECTKIQNLYAFEGVAPRIFDLIFVKDATMQWRIAQVTEILEDNERGASEIDNEKVLEIRRKYNVLYEIDPNPNHKYKNYFVDFSSHRFSGDIYENFVKDKVRENITWGSNPKPYQGIPELNIEGQRNLKGRIKAYDFDSLDFNSKTVLDYGCSGGHMCFEAINRGAKYAVGLDLPQVVDGAKHLANYLGYFNIDFYGDNFSHKGGRDVYGQIKNYTGESRFDIVFYFSCQQLGMPDYLPEIVGKYFYLEGHSGDHKETYEQQLQTIFGQSNVEFIGASRDHSIRPVFRAIINEKL